ncbi:MAG: hypothetical protein ABIA04_16465 [Pseudomonadota bacterium]
MIPNLFHTINVTIKQIGTASQRYDDEARELKKLLRYQSEFIIKAQIEYNKDSEVSIDNTGITKDVTGYLVVRNKDLSSIGYNPKIGDKIIKIGNESIKYQIVQIQNHGHYSDQDGSTLKLLWFIFIDGI